MAQLDGGLALRHSTAEASRRIRPLADRSPRTVHQHGGNPMSASHEFQFTLKDRQRAYLAEMAKKYRLDDESKALRCLVNYAIEKKDAEADIFQEIRCQDC
jgi:hypothetical protein